MSDEVTFDVIVDTGPPGLSAFEVAVQAGFTGTVSEWLKSLRGNPRQVLRNTIAAIGDSHTVGGPNLGEYQGALGPTYFALLTMMTHQRIHYSMNFAQGSSSLWGTLFGVQTPSQSDELARVLAMNPLPGACVLQVGQADVVGSTEHSIAEITAVVESMVAQCQAVDVVPILYTAAPLDPTGTGLPIDLPTSRSRRYQFNAWLRRFAVANGLPLIDSHTALTTVDDTWIDGTVHPDHLHPTAKGHRLIAQQALTDGLADIFAPNSRTYTVRQTDDLTSLFNDGTRNLGVFTTDTNSDGLADGLTFTGTATKSLVTPTADDAVLGNWQQLAATTGQTGTITAPLTGWTVGDRIAFSACFQAEDIETTGAEYTIAVTAATPGGFTLPTGGDVTTLYHGIWQWGFIDPTQGGISGGGDMNDTAEMYVEFDITPEMTALALNIALVGGSTGTAKLRVGEVTVRNLTTSGLTP